jgi:sugar phosphate isomerase/epimerase
MMGTQWRLVVLAGLFTLVTACGGGGEGGGDGVASIPDGQTASSTPAQDDDKTDDKMREYASCMKEHGFEVGELGEGSGMPAGADEEKWGKADAECKKLLPNGGAAPGGMSGEDLDKARELAQCLREHGLDVPDPTAGDGPFMTDDTADQETIDKAMEACAPDGVGEGNG